MGASAAVVTTTEVRHITPRKITFDWLSSDAGAAGATTTYSYSGKVEQVDLIPDTSTTAPSDQYDVVVNDADGRDILKGYGANCSGTNTISLTRGLGNVSESKLTLAVTNGGDAKGGIVVLYIR
jgi:hypothetical protein